MKARLLSIALAICMALSLTPVAYATEDDTAGGAGGTTGATETSVARIGDQYYDTLVAAVQAASDGQIIELLKDASGAGIGTFLDDPTNNPVKNFTIDFGGHTYTCVGPAVGSTGTQSQAFHLEWAGDGQKNAQVTLKNGKVTSAANSGVWMLVQNYCDLTLDGVTLDGANIGAGGYALSNNCGNVTIKDSTIIAPQGGFAFDSCDYSSYTGVTVTVRGESKIQGAIEHTNPNGDDNNARLVVEGGTFAQNTVVIDGGASRPLQFYVAKGYTLDQNGDDWTVKELRENGGMAVKPAMPQDGSVSATLEGVYGDANTTVEDGNADSDTCASNGNVTVDLSSAEGSEKATGATLTMPVDTAKSLANATSLTLKSNVGDVTLDVTALQKIGAEDLDAEVTVSIEKIMVSGDEVEAAYTVEVKANGKNLLPFGESDNGQVTIAVQKPEGSTDIQAWYAAKNGDKWVYVNELNAHEIDNGLLSIEIDHLSTIVLTSGEIVDTDVERYVAHLDDNTLYETLQAAVEAAEDGDTITILPGTHELAKNTTITLDKKITIQGATNSEGERAVIKCKGTNASGHGLFTLAEGSEGSVLDNFDISYTATGSDCAAIYLSAGFGGEGSETTLIQSVNIAGDGSAETEQAIGILSTYGAEGPLVVVANTFSNLKYGMYFNQITDLTVENNTIDNTRYNAINIAADSKTYPCSNITIAQNTLTNISSANYDDAAYSSGINVGAQTEGVKVEGNSISMLNGKKPINVVQPSGDQDAKSAVITYQVNGADYAIFVADIQSGTAAYAPPQDPEVPGYTFEGWDYGGATVTFDENGNATVDASSKQTFIFRAILKPVSSGGPGGGGVTTPSYDVTIAQPEGGTVSVDPTDAEAGEEVTVTVKPDEGLTLGDLIVTDEDGNTVKVAANEDGTYSFEMPEGDVTITATFVCDGGALCPTDKFTDIDQAQWYHFAIDWVVENGVMKGIGGTTLFAPDDDLLREQAATVMWNIMAEGDLEAPAAALSDVAQGEWYAPYVNWAVEAAVMEGHGGTDRFGVGEALTREQFAAVVAKATKADVSAADATALEGFNDPESVSEWAQATMAWAVEAGVINGVALSDGTLELQGSREITRAEMAMMIKNAVDEGVLEL